MTLGGNVWTDDGMLWTDGPDGMNVMFPHEVSLAALQRGVDRARGLGRSIVGAWLDSDIDTAPLARAGFEKGWDPWWMTADLESVASTSDARVQLVQDDANLGDGDIYGRELALTRLEPTVAWYAAAHTRKSGRFAGHAWSFRDGDLAGIFDVEVWPRFQRRGLGTALVSAVCQAARQAGARQAVLNATAEGKLLYTACGFTQIGVGTTWWHHLD